MCVQMYINRACEVCFYCLCVYGFNAEHSALDNQKEDIFIFILVFRVFLYVLIIFIPPPLTVLNATPFPIHSTLYLIF